MAKVIITAEVEDATKWEAGFRTHGELFRNQTIRRVDFGFVDTNVVACCFELNDLDTYMRILESPDTAEAMAFDGVKRETVKVFVMNKEFKP